LARLRRGLTAALFGGTLVLSGGAALVNEVVWQRSLKRFLGGSESTSSMIVVLVFMAGLGFGSLLMGRRARRLSDPVTALAALEALLFAVNAAIAFGFGSGAVGFLVHAQRVAASAGVPVLSVYAASAALVLLTPCLLMGATLPLASEICQRRLGLRDSRVLGLLYFANTAGSVAGALVAGFYLMPELGLTRSLALACSLNLAAALTLVALRFLPRVGRDAGEAAERVAVSAHASWTWRRPTLDESLAFGLGFCSLAYEMMLLRLIGLQDRPFPTTFAAVIATFLAFWSLGAAWSSRVTPRPLARSLRLTAVAVLLGLLVFRIGWPLAMEEPGILLKFVTARGAYFVAPFLFGYLFARLIADSAREWGRDVGRLGAWNTLGCCGGVVGVFFVGYDIHYVSVLVALSLSLVGLAEMAGPPLRRPWRIPAPIALLAAAAVVVLSGILDLSTVFSQDRLFFSRAGVIGMRAGGDMLWDGLWHSSLSNGTSHVATKNWYLGVCPILSHSPGDLRQACIIGLGTGITATTVSRLASIERVDVYEINPRLKEILAAYPDGTLHFLENAKMKVHWQDARTGLALDPRRYDVIVTQPFWLAQAGSSLLNSREFFELIRDHLSPGGIFTLASNGSRGQAFALRQTAARVFPFGESYFNGYLLVLSNDPIDVSEAALARRFAANADDPLWREIVGQPATRDALAVRKLVDAQRLPWGDGRLILTDDWPIVEYPLALERRVHEMGYTETLPVPH
jgi:spermidine synthase